MNDDELASARRLYDAFSGMTAVQRSRIQELTLARKRLEATGQIRKSKDESILFASAMSSAQPSPLESIAGTHPVLQLVVAYCNGQEIGDIAVGLDISEDQVISALRNAGVVLRNQSRSRPERQVEAQLLQRQGHSFRETGRRLGIAHTAVSRLLS